MTVMNKSQDALLINKHLGRLSAELKQLNLLTI